MYQGFGVRNVTATLTPSKTLSRIRGNVPAIPPAEQRKSHSESYVKTIMPCDEDLCVLCCMYTDLSVSISSNMARISPSVSFLDCARSSRKGITASWKPSNCEKGKSLFAGGKKEKGESMFTVGINSCSLASYFRLVFYPNTFLLFWCFGLWPRAIILWPRGLMWETTLTTTTTETAITNQHIGTRQVGTHRRDAAPKVRVARKRCMKRARGRWTCRIRVTIFGRWHVSPSTTPRGTHRCLLESLKTALVINCYLSQRQTE